MYKPLNETYLPLYETEAGRRIYDETLACVEQQFSGYVKEIQGTADGANVPFHKVHSHVRYFISFNRIISFQCARHLRAQLPFPSQIYIYIYKVATENSLIIFPNINNKKLKRHVFVHKLFLFNIIQCFSGHPV